MNNNFFAVAKSVNKEIAAGKNFVRTGAPGRQN
jgi:hypothetical protein